MAGRGDEMPIGRVGRAYGEDTGGERMPRPEGTVRGEG